MAKKIKPSTLFEQRVVATNVGYFLREFSLSKTKYVPEGRTEIEFADQVILIGDVIFLLQMKNRDAPSDERKRERDWFRENVWSHAVQQIRNTLEQVERAPPFPNDRGDQTRIPRSLDCLRVFKLVVYNMGTGLPEAERMTKHRPDETAGFIHIFHIDDYELMLQKLVTLTEVTEYLEYREAVVRQHRAAEQLPEAAVLGGFLRFQAPISPLPGHAEFASTLKDERDTFDISYIVEKYVDRVYNHFTQGAELAQRTASAVPYVPILEVLMLMPRNSLVEFKKRFTLGLKRGSGAPSQPMIFGQVSTDGKTRTGFVFAPVPAGHSNADAAKGLAYLTLMGKHCLRADLALGVSFRREGTDFLIDWQLATHPWKADAELDAFLEEHEPFGHLTEGMKPRYRFE